MARLPITDRRSKMMRFVLLQQATTTNLIFIFTMWFTVAFQYFHSSIRTVKSKEQKLFERMVWITKVTQESDAYCISELRMDRSTFGRLCEMLRDVGGLTATRNTSIQEVVAMFVYVLAHHKKSRTISLLFLRSRETVSRQFSRVLLAILRLHHILLKKPEPITDDCQDEKWRFCKVI